MALFVALSMNAQLLDEGFDDITTLSGWSFVNASDDPSGDYFQGNDGVFPAFDGDPTAYIGVNFNSTSGTNGTETISNWMILPSLMLENGSRITFYTRTGDASNFPDRLEVRVSPDGSSTAPANATDEGSYTELLLSVNENLDVGGYPETWTEFTAIVTGLSGVVDTSVAFRYFVTDAGPNGANSNYIGIDRVTVEDPLSVGDNAFDGLSHSVNAGMLNVRANQPLTGVEIYNVLGQQVITQRLSSNNEQINISALNAGVYIARVMIEGQTTSFKIVKR